MENIKKHSTPALHKILIIEDEPAIGVGLQYNLEAQGHKVTWITNGQKGLETALNHDFELIILDVMLPDLNGFEIAQGLREKNIHTPILMLTARHDVENRIHGLKLGADDYLAKPFDLQELLARVDALLRRAQWLPKKEGPSPKTYFYNTLKFTPDELILENELLEKKKTLTPIESKLLLLFFQNPGRAFPRTELLKQVWGLNADTQTRTLDNFIARLRQYFTELGISSENIESVRGVGYRLAKK